MGRHGNQIGKAASKDGGTVKTITLKAANAAKGTFFTAHAVVGFVDAGNFPAASCKPTLASGLRVFPPNQKASSFVPFPAGVCSHGPSSLRVRAVVR